MMRFDSIKTVRVQECEVRSAKWVRSETCEVQWEVRSALRCGFEPVLQDPQPHVPGFFRVKLDAGDAAAFDRSGEGRAVGRHRRRVGGDWRDVRMGEVHLRFWR